MNPPFFFNLQNVLVTSMPFALCCWNSLGFQIPLGTCSADILKSWLFPLRSQFRNPQTGSSGNYKRDINSQEMSGKMAEARRFKMQVNPDIFSQINGEVLIRAGHHKEITFLRFVR